MMDMSGFRLLVFFFIVSFLNSPLFAAAEDAGSIVKKIEENLNGKSAVMDIEMMVKTSRSKRTMRMKSYSIGQEKSFIKVLYPRKDEGITFLKVDNGMWQYVPRIEKVIKIPASMMLQSWMGSDFTNDDLVKESSLSDDYQAQVLRETGTEYELQLLPKDDAPVVWGKIVMSVSKQYFLPTTVAYYDEDDVLIRQLSYTDVKVFGERHYPSRWIMVPMTSEKKGHETIMVVSNALFDVEVDEAYFSKRALKRFSR